MMYRFMKFCCCNDPCAMSLMFMCSDFTSPPSSSCPAWAQLRLQHCTGLIGVVSTLAEFLHLAAQKKKSFLRSWSLPPLYNPPRLTPPPSPRTNVWAIILFHWSFSLDLTFLYLAEVNEEEMKREKRKIKEWSCNSQAVWNWVFISHVLCPVAVTCVALRVILCYMDSKQLVEDTTL